MSEPYLEATLTAVLRPKLLQTTLRSFERNLFSRGFRPYRLFINIDPLWGPAEAFREIVTICEKHFDKVVTRTPETPSFGGAVKWAWSSTTAEWIIHLEDDWLLNRRIKVDRLLGLLRSDVGQIALKNNWPSKPDEKLGAVFTSPSITNGKLARELAKLIDSDLDPAKQFRPGRNDEGVQVAAGYSRFHYSKGLPLLTDIGTSWRKRRGIVKRIDSNTGKSVWVNSDRGRIRTDILAPLFAAASRLLPEV